MSQLEDVYGALRKAVLDRYSAQGSGNPATAFVAFEFGTPVPDDTFRLRDDEHTLSPELGVEFLSRQSNMVPDISDSMLTRSERTIEGQYGLLLAGATAASSGSLDFFETIKSAAVEQFDPEIPSLLLATSKYRPVLATPVNWYDLSKTENWSHIRIDLQDHPPAPGPKINPGLLKWAVAPDALRAIIKEPVSGHTFQKLREVPLEATVVSPAVTEAHVANVERMKAHNVFLRPDTVFHSAAVESPSPRIMRRAAPGGAFGRRAAIDLGSVIGRVDGSFLASGDPPPQPHPKKVFNPLLNLHAAIDFHELVAVSGQDQPVTANQFFLEVDLCLVDIKRPWISDALMTLPNWFVPGFARGSFADATAARAGLMPVLPTACIFIRNLTIRSHWSAEDLQVIESSSSLGGFSMFGRKFDSNTMTLTVPGMQMFAWVCEPLPILPPADSPAN